MSRKRRVFPAKFKSKVALQAVKNLKTINELASEYDVHPNQVTQWKKQLLDGCNTLFEDRRGKKKPDKAQDSDKLFAEIGRLKMELDWLKKKMGY